MTHALRRFAALAIPVLALPLAACELDTLVVRVPDFDSKEVMGVTLWSTASEGAPRRALDVELLGPRVDERGVEVIGYSYAVEGRPVEVWGPLFRDAANPDQVTLALDDLPVAPGVRYRVSTFNAAGDSALSTQTFVL
jgi:hypothetical protein